MIPKYKNKKRLIITKEKLSELFVPGSFLLAAMLTMAAFIPFFVSFAEEEKSTAEIQEEIREIEQELSDKKEKEKTIETQVQVIEKNMEVIRLEIQKTEIAIKEFGDQIERKKINIKQIEEQMTRQREIMAEYIRLIQYGNNDLDFIMMGQRSDLGEYFKTLDSYEQLQLKIKESLEEIKIDKKRLEKEKAELEEGRIEQKKIFAMQEDQRKALEYEERKKSYYLEKTRDDIDLLSVERDELRSQLDALQSLGEPINLEKAIAAAKHASRKTGVRPAFLLGVLRVESNLGQNVGGGTYKVDMSPSQRDTFRDICDELGLKPSEVPVSRRICYNTDAADGCGGWGGAMGPAQFMPSTWIGYKDRVAEVTGNNPPNPWDLEDAMVAMGLKLSAVSGVAKGDRSAERKAAAMYLAGGNWEHYSWYGDRVLGYADGFEKYMDD